MSVKRGAWLDIVGAGGGRERRERSLRSEVLSIREAARVCAEEKVWPWSWRDRTERAERRPPFVQREFTCRKRRSTRPALRLSACAAVIFNPDTYVNTGASRPRQDATHLCQTNRIKCYIRKTPAFVSGIGALAAVAKASVSVARVSAGSMIPSSHSRAVAKYACDSPSYRCRIASWYLSASA